MSKVRETLIQVEPKLGMVLLGYREYDAFHRGQVLSVLELTPVDALALANSLATAAELIIQTTKEITNDQPPALPDSILPKASLGDSATIEG